VLLCVHPVNGDYVQGAFFACRLWEFALGMALGQLYRQRPGDAERWLFAPATLVAAGGIYWIGLHCYGSLAAYTVTDAFTGTGLFVILAQFSRSLGPLRPLEAALARVGAFSYGLYLLHQPYVLYVGDITVKHLSLVPYIAVGLALVALLAAVSMPVERFVNARVDRLLR
jgi:peptidoglycan/LPS O-acetylase OafA/YrhL